MQRVLILEPYFGGSHKHFLEGLQAHVAADYTLLSLPARKWKMRMQLSAVWFVHQIKNLSPDNRHFDTVLLSTFVDAAVFRAMVCQVPGWAPDTKIVTYYHENQFAYPQQYRESDNRQFTAINVTSALASDAIAFNTSFNRDTFLHGCRMYQQKISDMDFPDLAETLLAKSRVIHPGIDFKTID
ncbi:MAG: tRNA-queuosine alpha-mannosyltransferase domain-containing protein, partial [Desulforhopalus sp.]